MTIAFKWKYEAVVFDPTRIKDAIETDSTAGVDFCTIPTEAVVINSLNFKASIKSSKSMKTSSSGAKVEFYNCSDNTLFYLQRGNTIILRAGFEGQQELPLLLVGTITKSETRKTGADTLTSLTIQDSKYAKDNAPLGLSIPPRTFTYQQVIEALLKQAGKWGVPSEFVTQEGIVTETIKGGLTMEGELFRELEKLCDSIQYKVIYYLGRVRVEPKQFENSVQATVITPDNVLQGIHFHSTTKGKSAKDVEQNEGITFTTFLNGGINLNGDVINGIDLNTPIFADIAGYEGLYDPIEVEHKLEYEGQSWHTHVKTKRRPR